MFELLADPAAIAMLSTVGGGVLLKGGESLLKKKRARPPAVMSFKESTAYSGGRLPPPPRKKTVFDCSVYDQRQFEKKLVEAGIQNNVEIFCEDKECPECYPNRPGNGRTGAPRLRQKPPADPENIRRMKAEAKTAFAQSRSGRKRTAVVAGQLVPIPNNVPRWATGTLMHDSMYRTNFIGWKWHDENDKSKPIRSFRQNVTDEVFGSFPLAHRGTPSTGPR